MRIYELQREIYTMKQGSLTVTEFFGELMVRWAELESYRPIPSCSCDAAKSERMYRQQECVVCFLTGLNDEFSVVKSHVLMMDPLPGLNKVFSMVLQQESLGRLTGGGGDSKVMRNGVDDATRPQGRGRGQNERTML